MADQYVQIPGDGTGKKVRVFEIQVPTQDTTYLSYAIQAMEQQGVTLIGSDGRELHLEKLEGILEQIVEKLGEIHVALRGF